jgi:hypothetical protein
MRFKLEFCIISKNFKFIKFEQNNEVNNDSWRFTKVGTSFCEYVVNESKLDFIKVGENWFIVLLPNTNRVWLKGEDFFLSNQYFVNFESLVLFLGKKKFLLKEVNFIFLWLKKRGIFTIAACGIKL